MANADSKTNRSQAGARAAPHAPDYREAPYWVHDAPAPPAPVEPLPASADVVVIGSGYTGQAALEIARPRLLALGDAPSGATDPGASKASSQTPRSF